MQVLRDLEWRAIFAGIGTLVAVSFLIPLLLVAGIPLLRAVPELAPVFIWLSDSLGGRIFTGVVTLTAGWYVAYRTASQRKVFHGCLAPTILFVAFWLIGLVLVPLFAGR